MKKEGDDANRLSSGRDLVPIKASIIEDELQKLRMDFNTMTARRKRFVEHGAYEAGRSAGRKFTRHRGVEGAT